MKNIKFILLIITMLIVGCDDDDDFYSDVKPGGVWMKMGDGMIVGTSDIDYYDASNYTFYLKHELPYLTNAMNGGHFSVFVDREEIYQCTVHPIYSSKMPSGVFVSGLPFSPGFILQMNFGYIIDATKPIIDPRNDKRIIGALKKYGQYHEGMSFEIQSVTKSNNKMILTAELYNPDTFAYYYLDPDKMGIGLFHYFTNGLSLGDQNHNYYTHKEVVITPEPWDSWDKNWMSLIKSGERKRIIIEYNNFEEIPPGNYMAHFSFPGLPFITEKKEIQQADGRIWLGGIYVIKDFVIE